MRGSRSCTACSTTRGSGCLDLRHVNYPGHTPNDRQARTNVSAMSESAARFWRKWGLAIVALLVGAIIIAVSKAFDFGQYTWPLTMTGVTVVLAARFIYIWQKGGRDWYR